MLTAQEREDMAALRAARLNPDYGSIIAWTLSDEWTRPSDFRHGVNGFAVRSISGTPTFYYGNALSGECG